MEFFHPDRKHLLTDDGPPLLENFQSVIPHLMLYPGDEPNQWILSCFLPSSAYNSFSYFQMTCYGVELNQLLAKYYSNPEAFFKDSMKWYPPEVKAPTTTKQPARLNLTIEDLGL